MGIQYTVALAPMHISSTTLQSYLHNMVLLVRFVSTITHVPNEVIKTFSKRESTP
jgi:hypothetical protein